MKQISIPCTGYSIQADWYDGSTNQIALFLPGFTSSKERYQTLVESILKQTNSSALVIDYSGHGESPFDIQDITISENFSEVVRAYDWLAINHPDKEINVIGTSYGGYFAARLAAVRKVNKLILRVPANYDMKQLYTPWRNLSQEQIRNEYRADPKNFESHPVLNAAKDFEGKAFVLTHEFDEACPKTSTDPYIAAFGAETWEAKGFKHGLGPSNPSNEQMEEYVQVIADWLLS